MKTVTDIHQRMSMNWYTSFATVSHFACSESTYLSDGSLLRQIRARDVLSCHVTLPCMCHRYLCLEIGLGFWDMKKLYWSKQNVTSQQLMQNVAWTVENSASVIYKITDVWKQVLDKIHVAFLPYPILFIFEIEYIQAKQSANIFSCLLFSSSLVFRHD